LAVTNLTQFSIHYAKMFYIDLEPADFWADFEQRIRAINEVAKRFWAVSMPKESTRTLNV